MIPHKNKVARLALATTFAIAALTACSGSNGVTPSIGQSSITGQVYHASDVELSTSPAICAKTPSPAPTRFDSTEIYKACHQLPNQSSYPFAVGQKFRYTYTPDDGKENYAFRPEENILALFVGDAGTLTVERLGDAEGADDLGVITAFDPGTINPAYARADDRNSLPSVADYPNNFTQDCTAPIVATPFGKTASFKITMRKEDVDRYGPSGVALFEDDRHNIGSLTIYVIPTPPPPHF